MAITYPLQGGSPVIYMLFARIRQQAAKSEENRLACVASLAFPTASIWRTPDRVNDFADYCATSRVAVEVNLEIVPRSTYDAHKLQHGDRVEIVRAIGGG